MIDLALTAAAADTRLFLPSLLEAAPHSLSAADAAARADEAASAVESLLGRDPWRQGYVERLTGRGGQVLMLARWPIEDDPPAVTVIDNGAVDVATYSVTGRRRHSLYRPSGWDLSGRGDLLTGDPLSPPSTLWYTVTYTAGWLMPGQVGAWSAAKAYAAETASVSYLDARGSWVRATDRRVTLRFECTAGGTTGGTEPAAFAAAAAGDEVTDGTVTWTARAAHELPADLSEAALELALVIHRQRQRDQAVLSMSAPGSSVKYGEQIPESIAAVIRGYR